MNRNVLTIKAPAVPLWPLVLAVAGAVVLGACGGCGRKEHPAWRTKCSLSNGDQVNRIAFSRDGRYLAVGSGGRRVWVIGTATGTKIALTWIGASANSLAFSADSRYLAVAANDATARVLGTTTGKHISCVKRPFAENAWREKLQTGKGSSRPDHGGWVESAVFAGDRNYVALWCNGQSWTTLAFDAVTGKQLGRNRDLCMVDFGYLSPDGRYQANICDDGTVRVIETANGKLVGMARFGNNRGRYPGPGRLLFSSDSRYLAVPVQNEEWYGHGVRLLEAATAKELSNIRFEDLIYPGLVGFTRDGRSLAVAVDTTVGIFETATGRKIRSLDVGRRSWSDPLAFSPDGRYLAVGSGKLARVLEVATGKEVFKTGFGGKVDAVEFSPDGRYLAAHDETTVRVLESGAGREGPQTRD